MSKEVLFNFLHENWGDLASVFGVFVTIVFSFQAKSAARAAKLASEGARSRLLHIDYYAETKRMIALVDELDKLLADNKYERASEKAATLRYGCHSLASIQETKVTVELQGRVKRLPTQFRSIVEALVKLLDPNQADPELIKYRRIVGGCRDTLTLLENELKISLGEKDG